MKKLVSFVLICVLLFTLAGCGKNENDRSPENIDVDLTALSSTMVYSEVYNMTNNPNDYLGKTVKMKGNFAVYQDETTDNYYFACLIADAASCCSQGIEFVWAGDHSYPEDYPQLNTQITVVGVFGTYEENGYTYCQLTDADVTI